MVVDGTGLGIIFVTAHGVWKVPTASRYARGTVDEFIVL